VPDGALKPGGRREEHRIPEVCGKPTVSFSASGKHFQSLRTPHPPPCIFMMAIPKKILEKSPFSTHSYFKERNRTPPIPGGLPGFFLTTSFCFLLLYYLI
jgi:hypothetical protein